MGRGWRGEAALMTYLFVLGKPENTGVRNLDVTKFRSQHYHFSPV